MKISCVQTDTYIGKNPDNITLAEKMIREAMKESPDVILLPETWNSGYFPKEHLENYCDRDGMSVKKIMGQLAKELRVNIVAGSVANTKNGSIYNTSYTFNRDGECVNEYDKTHLFTPMHEDGFFTAGDRLSCFTLDGHTCAVLICYDIRFPELTRTLTVKHHPDYLFVVSQWPKKRIDHLLTLAKARAVENQMFVAFANSCDKSGDTVFGGRSSIFDPWGNTLATASEDRDIIFADCDDTALEDIRGSINVFRDRRPELYQL